MQESLYAFTDNTRLIVTNFWYSGVNFEVLKVRSNHSLF